ncbi:hypothetical protein [Neptuniibacter sp. QD37_11]|uniref:hypothetical protein n=1 Tax=Neptuniibacter sp. QD37_11 TaxID=3398209 RepID=UPI0039F4C6BA
MFYRLNALVYRLFGKVYPCRPSGCYYGFTSVCCAAFMIFLPVIIAGFILGVKIFFDLFDVNPLAALGVNTVELAMQVKAGLWIVNDSPVLLYVFLIAAIIGYFVLVAVPILLALWAAFHGIKYLLKSIGFLISLLPTPSMPNAVKMSCQLVKSLHAQLCKPVELGK